MNLSKVIVAFLLVAFCATSRLFSQELINLGNNSGALTDPLSVNDSDQIVGAEIATSGTDTAFLYSNGTFTDLGTLSGDTQSTAEGINNSGQIVGNSVSAGNVTSAFLYSGNKMINLGSLGGTNTEADGINNAGQIIGTSETSGNAATHAFISLNGTMTDLSPANGSFTIGYAINNSGQAAGSSANAGALLFSNGTITDLGTLGGGGGLANSINDSGQIAGWSNTSPAAGGNEHAFISLNGTLTDLGTLGGTTSHAYGINNSGQVVGMAYLSSQSETAFVYSSATGMQNLNVVYASLLVTGTGTQTGFISLDGANDVNNEGDIVGFGTYWNGTSDIDAGFLLKSVVTPVPEPKAWQFVSPFIILAWLFFRTIRRRLGAR